MVTLDSTSLWAITLFILIVRMTRRQSRRPISIRRSPWNTERHSRPSAVSSLIACRAIILPPSKNGYCRWSTTSAVTSIRSSTASPVLTRIPLSTSTNTTYRTPREDA